MCYLFWAFFKPSRKSFYVINYILYRRSPKPIYIYIYIFTLKASINIFHTRNNKVYPFVLFIFRTHMAELNPTSFMITNVRLYRLPKKKMWTYYIPISNYHVEMRKWKVETQPSLLVSKKYFNLFLFLFFFTAKRVLAAH